jgi:hypothetical protein
MIEYFFRSLTIGEIFRFLFYLFVLFAIIGFIKGSLKKINNVISNWHEYLEYHPFSPKEFYASVTEELRSKDIPQLVITTIYYPQGGLFSMSREYLRIRCGEYVFDVCAAPFGKGFFVSYWMGVMPDPIRDVFKNMPWVGKFFRQREKTFFELDNETLFKELASTAVRKVFKQLHEQKGIRDMAINTQITTNAAL